LKPSGLREHGRKGQEGEQILTPQILVVGQNLGGRHARAEQLKQRLDGIPEPTDAWLPMAHDRINRDARD